MNDPGKNSKEQILSYMEELSAIYKTVKPLILLAEYYNSNQGIVLSSMNELRNSFDHIMRSFFEGADSKEEFFKAKGHLFRAAYDACEIIIIDRLEYINLFKNTVGFNLLYKAYPDYYTKVLPFISQVKENLGSLRQNPNSLERINEYQIMAAQLIETCDDLNKAAPFINEKYKKIDTTTNQQISVVVSVLGFIGIAVSVLSVLLNVSVSLIILIISLLLLIFFIGLWLFYKKKK
jgi:hypothetical protein